MFEPLSKHRGRPFVAVIGPRGSGKTTLLKQLLAGRKDALYLSLDSVEVENLFETIKELTERYAYTTFLLDEIHHYRAYDQELKKIYDFLDVSLIFTSSVALSLYESVYDLSRRVVVFNLYSFSFREYVYFKTDILLSELSVQQIIQKTWDKEHLRFSYLFEPFIKGDLLPFSMDDPDILKSSSNILNKIIMRDIPHIAKLTMDELDIINKMVRFIGSASVDGISYSSLSNNLKITKYKAEQYVHLLEKAFIVQRVMPKGTNVLKEPKLLLFLPYRLLFKPYEEALGGLREDFFIEMMAIKGRPAFYLKSTTGEKTPDYLVTEGSQDYILEIGGKGKGREQFKGIDIAKSIILSQGDNTQGIRRPLFLIGF
jgi:predicted AAA+ superfamily ATPase